MDDDRARDDDTGSAPLRVRRMVLSLGLAAVFVVVIPVSVQEEEGWHLPGFGSSHASTPAPAHTVLVGHVGRPTGAVRSSSR